MGSVSGSLSLLCRVQCVLRDGDLITVGLVNLEQNQIIKIFSVLAVIFMPPTLIASIYGMKVTIPGEDAPYMFVMLMLGSALLALLVAWWFYRHGWLSFRLKRYD